MKYFVLAFSLFFITQEKLAIMISQFNKGEYRKCIESGENILSEEVNRDALKYIILSYIRLNQCIKAQKYIRMWKNSYPYDELPFYYAGLCDFKMGRHESAAKNFSHSITAPFPYNEYSLLMKAITYVKMEKYEKALEVLSKLRNAKHDRVREKAVRLEHDVRGRELYYDLLLEMSFQHDSNAGLIPDNETLRTLFIEYYGRGEDVVGSIYLRGRICRRMKTDVYAGGEYKFYQNLHSGLHNLNFQVHRIEGRVLTRKIKKINGGGGLFYSRAFISTSLAPFSEGIGGAGFVDFRVIGVMIRGDVKIYREAFFEGFTGNQDRDGWFFETALSGNKAFKRIFVDGKMLFRFNEADGDDWDSTSMSMKIGFNFNPINWLSFISRISYTYRTFFNVDSIFGIKRKDHEIEWIGSVVYSPFKWFELIGSYSFVREYSKIEIYSYTRHIVGAGLRLRVGG